MMPRAIVRLNSVVDNTTADKVIPCACRVIARDAGKNKILLIRLPQSKDKNPKRQQDYIRAPFEVCAMVFNEWLERRAIYFLNLDATSNLQLTDNNLLCSSSEKERNRRQRDIEIRDRRYDIVCGILSNDDGTSILSCQDFYDDPTRLKGRISQVAAAKNISRTTALNVLHIFWAGGSQVNALLPRYHKCGNPGEPKVSTKKLGRPSRKFKTGQTDTAGYVLEDEDKDKLAWGYALVTRERPLREAYSLMSGKYWATHDIDSNGDIVPNLFPASQRPTYPQFIYWGKKLSKKKVKELLMGPTKAAQQSYAAGKSEQDMVSMIGQKAGFDGTKTDVYLCRVNCRHKKLPCMTRSILKDIRTGLIIGIYAGWDSPSPATALKTILNAVDDKVAYCARFGVQIEPNSWPSFLPRTILADNGELKGKTPTEAERQFGFGIEYTPVGRGDRKGSVETQHHTDHKKLDHRLPGTTKGKQRQRGQKHPAVEALWNYHEYMRELILHVIEHNTREEVPDLAPVEMLLEVPRISPTRLNIHRWLEQRGMSADIPVNVENFRAFTLPDWPATLHKNGVFLKAQVHERWIRITRLRYRSDELVATGLMSKVKQSGSPIDVTVKIDTEDLRHVWLVTPKGLLKLRLESSDQTLMQKITLTEWLIMLTEQTNHSDSQVDERDQFDLDRTMRRERITKNAKKELQAEEMAMNGRPSQRAIKNGLLSNLAEEVEQLHLDAPSSATGSAFTEIRSIPLEEPENKYIVNPILLMRSVMSGLNDEEEDREW